MIAQYYTDSDPVVRIFYSTDQGFNQGFMDCLIVETGKEIDLADKALKKCHLRRKEKWEKRQWGYETRVSWK